jgi:hypothetical protein
VDLVGTIRLNAEQVAGSSRTLAELSSDLHSGAEHQAGDTAQIRDSPGELEATIQQVAGDASQAADASRHAGRAVAHGQQVIGLSLTGLHALVGEVQGNAQMIEHLAEESATIGGVLTVIRSIADQTNLLALNAHRSRPRREMGRGFAVVAEEVRSWHSAPPAPPRNPDPDRRPANCRAAIGRRHARPGRTRRSHRQQAQAADGALDKIVGAIQTISDTAVRIADVTAQQSGASAKSAITASGFINWVGITCCALAKGESKGKTCWCWAGNCIRPFRRSASDELLIASKPAPTGFLAVHNVCVH